MTRALYFGSHSRQLKDFVHYGVYPLVNAALRVGLTASGHGTGSAKTAALWASSLCGIFYIGLTTDYFGKEAGVLDYNAREAISAEMGIAPEQLKFSDYWDTPNHIVKRERSDFLKLQAIRYITDAFFFIPMALEFFAHGLNSKTCGRMVGSDEAIQTAGNLSYAAKAAYWVYETFMVEKTAHYDIVKFRETIESTGRDASFNDVLAIYNRMRNDKGLSTIREHEKEYLRPLLTRIAENYNHSPNMTVPAMVYLFGFDKVNIHDASGKINQAVIDQSLKEIEHVAAVGLDGIRKENAARKQGATLHGEMEASAPKVSFVERIGRNILDFGFNSYASLRGPVKPPEEYLSDRDHTTWANR